MWKRDLFILKPPVYENDEKNRRAKFLHYASLLLFFSNLVLFLITQEFGTQAAKSVSWLLGGIVLFGELW